MAEVVLEQVRKRYGDVVAVHGVDLRVAPGEFVTLLGPSGCGKTTCLRMVAGFVEPDRGRVLIGGADVTRTPPYRRNAGMVFQSYALFPHKTVAANVAFGMKMRGVSRSETEARTREALRLVKLDQMADRYPGQLSGGQKQRVALARAVVIRPEVLLLDEPLGALDLKLREELQVEIKRVQATLGITTIFVTHDQGEALGMSNRVAVMREGRIVQIDAPNVLYAQPNSEYVANFVGRTNLIDVVVVERHNDGSYVVAAWNGRERSFRVNGTSQTAFDVGERCLLAARPEHFEVGSHQDNVLRAKVLDVIYRGSTWNVELADERGRSFSAVLGAGRGLPGKGEEVAMTWPASCCYLLKAEEPETATSV
jgi:spermidine/putrescine ABC transporter ATP-binding subunit